ncbi:hypothetical protein SDC9_132386 [bioreactor metagenome]|uniref:Uncharacterized protein n=1 Tax=bioreactor metagenome TaxID=1076179 RepID=A0A645D8C2_9ZZZZ
MGGRVGPFSIPGWSCNSWLIVHPVGSVDEPGSQGVKSPGVEPQAGGEVALDAAEPRIDLIERRVQVALADAQNRQQ